MTAPAKLILGAPLGEGGVFAPPPPTLPVVVDEPPATAPLVLAGRERFHENLVGRYGEARAERYLRLVDRLAHGHLVDIGPFSFIEGSERHGHGWRSERWRFVFCGDDIVRFAGVDGLPIFLAQTLCDVAQHQDDILTLCAQNDGRVLRTRADVERLQRPLPDRLAPLPAAVAAQWEPPHFDGRVLRFVVDGDATVARVAVDADSYAVDVHVLGRTALRRPIEREIVYPQPVVGRAYVDDAGAVVVASIGGASSASASAWVAQARSEHASIASFARLTLELMAAGAPLRLIARVHEAALDEVRHTEQCLALAARDGVDVVLGPLPALAPRSGDRFAIAQRTHDEAVVEEGAAIVHMRAWLPLLDDTARSVVAAQIVDEERHLQLANDIVRWGSTP